MMQQPAMQPPPGGSLGEALRNLQKYVQNESFNNQKGQTQEFGPLQFDTKGVEFGPWIRRFISQVRRNWFVPLAAMTMRGRVVITFNVHRNGALTDVTVVRPSEIDSFNTAAVNALLASNPTTPLPPEYPDDKAFFTVTFYYNESPPGRSETGARLGAYGACRCQRARAIRSSPFSVPPQPARARSASRLPSDSTARSSTATRPPSIAASTSAPTRCRCTSGAAFRIT